MRSLLLAFALMLGGCGDLHLHYHAGDDSPAGDVNDILVPIEVDEDE